LAELAEDGVKAGWQGDEVGKEREVVGSSGTKLLYTFTI
jgi:hypothetical protein